MLRLINHPALMGLDSIGPIQNLPVNQPASFTVLSQVWTLCIKLQDFQKSSQFERAGWPEMIKKKDKWLRLIKHNAVLSLIFIAAAAVLSAVLSAFCHYYLLVPHHSHRYRQDRPASFFFFCHLASLILCPAFCYLFFSFNRYLTKYFCGIFLRSSSPPLLSHCAHSPGGVTGDHSVTDLPWGARSTIYSSFGVNASCLLQFPPRCRPSLLVPCIRPHSRCAHLQHTVKQRVGVNAETAQFPFSPFLWVVCTFKQTYRCTGAQAHVHTWTN